MPRAGQHGVEAGGLRARRRGAHNISQRGKLILADEARQAARVVIWFDEGACRIRVVPLRQQ
jgi:hypothetical protein